MKTNLCHCQFVLMPSNIHFFLGPLLIGIPSHWLFACRSRFSPSTGVCWAWNPPIVADHHDTPAVTGGLHPLLDIFTEEPKNPDVTLWPGNVPGQWLHVRLLVSEVAFEPPVVSLVKSFHLRSPTSTTVLPGSYELANKCLNGSFSVNFQLVGRP